MNRIMKIFILSISKNIWNLGKSKQSVFLFLAGDRGFIEHIYKEGSTKNFRGIKYFWNSEAFERKRESSSEVAVS